MNVHKDIMQRIVIEDLLEDVIIRSSVRKNNFWFFQTSEIQELNWPELSNNFIINL